jgi:hypothetical protein
VQRLLETTDRSLVEALRLALEGEEIPFHVLETGVASMPFMPTVVMVAEQDLAAAQAVLNALQVSSIPTHLPRGMRRAQVALLALLSVIVVLCLCFAM